MRTRPADLTGVVLDGVDRIQHLCMHLLLADPADLDADNRRTRDRCLDYFRLLDGIVAEIVSAAGPEASTLIVSDHGAEPAGRSIFYANTWLERQGLLRWADDVPVDRASRLALNGNTEVGNLFDWNATTAAALTSSSNAIFVHRALHAGDPGITTEEYPGFCRKLAEALLAIHDPTTGRPVVDRVLLGSDTFPGRFQQEAPDLTLVLREPGFLSVLRGPEITAERRTPYGTHHPHGILITSGPGINAIDRKAEPMSSVVDVAPTIMTLLGLSVPEQMTGSVLAGVLAPRRTRTVPDAEPSPSESAPEPAFDPEGEAEIIARLQRLGYLE